MRHTHTYNGHPIAHQCHHDAPSDMCGVCVEPCDIYVGSYYWNGGTYQSLERAQVAVDRFRKDSDELARMEAGWDIYN